VVTDLQPKLYVSPNWYITTICEIIAWFWFKQPPSSGTLEILNKIRTFLAWVLYLSQSRHQKSVGGWNILKTEIIVFDKKFRKTLFLLFKSVRNCLILLLIECERKKADIFLEAWYWSYLWLRFGIDFYASCLVWTS
jgi:hypothetical protein